MVSTILPPTRSQSKAKTIAYWIITALISFELVQGALWDLNVVNPGYVYDVLRQLGYPLYLASILGVSKLVAAAIFLMPGVRLWKEWAYAGVVILFTGAWVSHLLVGDGPEKFIWSMLFDLLTIGSWALRPYNRRLIEADKI